MSTMEAGNYDAPPMSDTEKMGLKMDYIKSPTGGILKIAELGLSMITFICASVWAANVRNGSGEWAQFVSLTAFILTLIISIMYLFGILPDRTPEKCRCGMVEAIYYIVVSLMWLVTAIVASAFGSRHSSCGAAAFFAWATFIVFVIDTVLRVMFWRGRDPNFLSPKKKNQDTGPPDLDKGLPPPQGKF